MMSTPDRTVDPITSAIFLIGFAWLIWRVFF